MATTAPKRSSYRERRIHVMLNEGTALDPPPPSHIAPPPLPQAAPQPPQAAPRLRQSFPPAQRPPARLFIASLLKNQPYLIYVGLAAAILCVSAIFLLFHQAHPSIPTVKVSEHATSVPPPAAATAPAQSTPAPVAAKTVPSRTEEATQQQEPAASEPVQFKVKRSKPFEKVGPIRLKLIKTNLKWNTCDVYIAAGGPSYQKQLHLNKPFEIELPHGAGFADLLVTSMGKDQVSGLVQQKQ